MAANESPSGPGIARNQNSRSSEPTGLTLNARDIPERTLRIFARVIPPALYGVSGRERERLSTVLDVARAELGRRETNRG